MCYTDTPFPCFVKGVHGEQVVQVFPLTASLIEFHYYFPNIHHYGCLVLLTLCSQPTLSFLLHCPLISNSGIFNIRSSVQQSVLVNGDGKIWLPVVTSSTRSLPIHSLEISGLSDSSLET